MRARCWLFFSYMVAFGAIAGAVAVLIKTTSSSENVQVGVVRPILWLIAGLELAKYNCDTNLIDVIRTLILSAISKFIKRKEKTRDQLSRSTDR